MGINEVVKNICTFVPLGILGVFLFVMIMLGFIAFISDVVTPFFQGFSSERRMERFIERKCIEGNEIAIEIKRCGYYSYWKDQELMRAAIDGNEHAIRALKIPGRK